MASGAASGPGGHEVHLLTSEASVDRLDSGGSTATGMTSAASAHQVRSKKGHRHHDKSMSKKTNSTDNIIDFVTTSSNTIADPRSTEVLTNLLTLLFLFIVKLKCHMNL